MWKNTARGYFIGLLDQTIIRIYDLSSYWCGFGWWKTEWDHNKAIENNNGIIDTYLVCRMIIQEFTSGVIIIQYPDGTWDYDAWAEQTWP